MRVVLTGCSVREPDRAGLRRRYPAVDLFLRPDEEPELVDRLGLASAQAPIGAGGPSGATTTVGRTVVGAADHLPGTRALAVGQGTVARGSAIAAWLPIIYGCDKTCTYCIVPFSRGPGAEPAVRRHRRRGARPRRGRLSRGHAARPERQLVRPRPAARAALRARRRRQRWAGRRLDLAGRPDLAELIRAIDGLRTADGRPAIGRLRFVTSHPWDLSDRLIAALADVRLGLRAPPPARPVGRRTRCSAGWAASTRSSTIASGWRASARRSRTSRSRPTSSSGSAARPRPSSRRRSRSSRRSATTRSSPRPTRRDRARRRTRLDDDVPGRRQASPAQRAARAPGGDRPRAQRGVARTGGRGPGRRDPAANARTSTTATRPPTTPAHRSRAPARAGCPAGPAATSSSTSRAIAALVGREVLVRIEHAGPYALRGALVGA